MTDERIRDIVYRAFGPNAYQLPFGKQGITTLGDQCEQAIRDALEIEEATNRKAIMEIKYKTHMRG